MSIRFLARDRRRDRDNLLTTVVGFLGAAGVIVNDNIKSLNNSLFLLPAVIDKDERVKIEVMVRARSNWRSKSCIACAVKVASGCLTCATWCCISGGIRI
jgi:hypothetical protein